MDLQKDRFSRKPLKGGDVYIFDRWLFFGMMILVFVGLFLYLYKNNFDLDYFECGGNPFGPSGMCKNPFYSPPSWKNAEYLTPGEYGKKPTLFFNSLPFLIIGLFIFLLILNHNIYNKHKLKFGDMIEKDTD